MPIYEYRCAACGHELEALQKFSDPTLTDCPACGQAALKRLISAVGFRLKGGGWYETDFKSGNRRNLAGESKTDANAKSGSEAKSGDKATTAKTEAKTDSSTKPARTAPSGGNSTSSKGGSAAA